MIKPEDFEQVPVSSLTNLAHALQLGGRAPADQSARQWIEDLKDLLWWTVEDRTSPQPIARPQPPPPSVTSMSRGNVELLRAWMGRLHMDLKENGSAAAEAAYVAVGLIRDAQAARRQDIREREREVYGTAEIVDEDDNDDATS